MCCICCCQIINAGITSGAKDAINLWRRHSVSSSDSAIEPEDMEASEIDDHHQLPDFDQSVRECRLIFLSSSLVK